MERRLTEFESEGGGGGLRLQRTLVDECMEKAEFQL